MSCSEKDSAEVDSERLPDLDSEPEVQGSVYATQDMNLPTETVDPDEEEKEVNDSQNELSVAYVFQIMDSKGNLSRLNRAHEQRYPNFVKPARNRYVECKICHTEYPFYNKSHHLNSAICRQSQNLHAETE